MKNLMENPILVKLQQFGQKLGSNNFLGAVQSGMMGSMAIIMVGSVCSIICAIGPMIGIFETGSNVYNIIYLPYRYTMDCISLWVVAGIAYHYAKALKLKAPLINVLNCLIVFLIVASGNPISSETGVSGIANTNFGAVGMFTGFLIVFVVINIEKICIDKNIRIRMPDVCPPPLQNSFNAIMPLLFSVIIVYGGNVAIMSLSGGTLDLFSVVTTVLAVPLGSLTSVPGMFIIVFFGTLLWCFGIHGSMVVSSVLMPLLIEAISYNAAAFASGGYEALKFFPVLLYSAMSLCGGAGNVLPLCIMGLRSKSEQIRTVSKLGVIPGLFGINEPIIFGMPIMYNPILCIPFILNSLVVTAFTYVAYMTGFLVPVFIPIYTMLPMGVASFFGSMRWQNALWSYLAMIPSAIVWYPFFKVYEKQLLLQEETAKELASE